ncbi:hypothetical protein C8A01DRAFT_21456, partial [Parachaetomium inaequale]
NLAEAIDSRRRNVVDKILIALHELIVSFRDGSDECSFECSSIRLGALTKEMRARRLDPKPGSPLLGYSIAATMDAARSIRSPQWASPNRSAYGYVGYVSHSCDLGSLIQSKMDGLEEMMGGLTLDDFDGHRSLGHARVS